MYKKLFSFKFQIEFQNPVTKRSVIIINQIANSCVLKKKQLRLKKKQDYACQQKIARWTRFHLMFNKYKYFRFRRNEKLIQFSDSKDFIMLSIFIYTFAFL